METNDLSSMISAITSDPAMMSRVMGALSSLSAGGAENSDNGKEEHGSRQGPEREKDGVSLPAGLSDIGHKDGGHGMSDRKRLLVALKPYLSQSRRDKAEMLINIMALLDSGILNMIGKGE